jgi:hypothetical protein
VAIVVPYPESVKNLPVALNEKQVIVAETLLDVLSQHPHSRILLWASLFILQAIGLPQAAVASWFGCSTRNVRHINQQVRSTCRGDGKTGRPPQPETTPPKVSPHIIGYSAYAGLWLLLPGLLTSRLLQFIQRLTFLMPIAGLAPWQWVLTVLVLAWLGFSRLQHLRDLCDVGVALFTGRGKVLDADRARKAMKAIPHQAGQQFYQATAQAEWETIPDACPWVSIDEHTVGHQGGPEMPRAKVPRFGRVRRAHHLFGTFVLGVRRFVGLVVTQANRRLCHVATEQLTEARQHQARVQPESVGLRSILDRGSYRAETHEALQALRDQGVQYVALARRTQKNVAYWDSLVCTGLLELHPYTHHHDLALPPEQRRDHFFLSVCQTPLTFKPEGQKQEETIWVPTILIVNETKLFAENFKDKYVAAFFGTLDLPPGLQAQVYPSRQEHELAYRDVIHALGFDALPKGYIKQSPDRSLNDPAQETVLETKNIFLLSWLRLWAYNRVTQFLAHLPQAYRRLTVLTAARKFLRRPGLLLLEKDSLVVQLDPFPDQAALSDYLTWINEQRLAIPWLSGLALRVEIADRPAAQTIPATQWRKLLSAPT